MKTTYRTLRAALLATILLFSISFLNTVSASDIEIATVESEVVLEESVAIESWMLSLNEWDLELKVELEDEQLIEGWMLDANQSNWENISTVDTEQEQELESWMTNLSKW